MRPNHHTLCVYAHVLFCHDFVFFQHAFSLLKCCDFFSHLTVSHWHHLFGEKKEENLPLNFGLFLFQLSQQNATLCNFIRSSRGVNLQQNSADSHNFNDTEICKFFFVVVGGARMSKWMKYARVHSNYFHITYIQWWFRWVFFHSFILRYGNCWSIQIRTIRSTYTIKSKR